MELPVGGEWWSVAPAEFVETFNPNEGDPMDGGRGARFSPFDDAHGNRIPTKYFGEHQSIAIAERLMREGSDPRMVSLEDVFAFRLGRYQSTTPLQLVDLNAHMHEAVVREAFQGGKEAEYIYARSLAAQIHHQVQSAQGIRYAGVQMGMRSLSCIMLFHGRVENDCMRLQEALAFDSGVGLRYLRESASERRFTLPETLVRRLAE